MTERETNSCDPATCQHARNARLRQLNDDLRRHGRGGTLCITRGIQALGPDMLAAVLLALRCFEDFTDDNDPYGEHDFGVLRVAGERVMWKIDCHDRERRYGSPDPANAAVTTRVLTIMLAAEY